MLKRTKEVRQVLKRKQLERRLKNKENNDNKTKSLR